MKALRSTSTTNNKSNNDTDTSHQLQMSSARTLPRRDLTVKIVTNMTDADANARAPALDIVTAEEVVNGTPRREGWPPCRSLEATREILLTLFHSESPCRVWMSCPASTS